MTFTRLRKEMRQVSNYFNKLIIWHHHMKDHFDMDHLTKFDAFMLNKDQAMDL